MKKIILQLTLSTFIFLFASCAEDGIDGDIYVAITTDGNCISDYTDDNGNVPYGLTYGSYYGPCSEGTYSYTYHFCDGSGWYGTYYIWKNSGTDASFLTAGEDGADKYFLFHMGISGGYTSRKAHDPEPAVLPEDPLNNTRVYNLGTYSIKIESHYTTTKNSSSPGKLPESSTQLK